MQEKIHDYATWVIPLIQIFISLLLLLLIIGLGKELDINRQKRADLESIIVAKDNQILGLQTKCMLQEMLLDMTLQQGGEEDVKENVKEDVWY